MELKKMYIFITIFIFVNVYSQVYLPNGRVNSSSNGNMGIKTSVPTKDLEVNGSILSKRLFVTNHINDGVVFRDWEERNDSCLVFSAGNLVGSGGGYLDTRMLHYFVVPESNLDKKSWFYFGLEDRTGFSRLNMSAETNGYTRLFVGNREQQGILKLFEDGNDNVYLQIERPNSRLVIGGYSDHPKSINNKLFINNGNARVEGNIIADGKIGIGTDSPQYKLTVNGNSYSTEHTIQSWSPILILKRDTEEGGFIQGVQTKLYSGENNWFFGNLHQESWIVSKGDYLGKLFEIKNSGNASLQGKFEAKEVKVTSVPTADFVFEDNYHLPKLEDIEKHIKEKKHLPEIPSASQMEQEGLNIGEFQIKLLQKIEELTLYSIEQNKKIKELEDKIEQLLHKKR